MSTYTYCHRCDRKECKVGDFIDHKGAVICEACHEHDREVVLSFCKRVKAEAKEWLASGKYEGLGNSIEVAEFAIHDALVCLEDRVREGVV